MSIFSAELEVRMQYNDEKVSTQPDTPEAVASWYRERRRSKVLALVHPDGDVWGHAIQSVAPPRGDDQKV